MANESRPLPLQSASYALWTFLVIEFLQSASRLEIAVVCKFEKVFYLGANFLALLTFALQMSYSLCVSCRSPVGVASRLARA